MKPIAVRRASGPLPRALHPGAWWIWALGMATAASRTTNPILLALVIAVVGFVVARRRSDAPWASGFRAYLVMAFVVVAIRVVFRIVLGGGTGGGTVLFTLPRIPLPKAAGGIRLGGPVPLGAVLAAVYDGLRLATLLVCVGAANLLADPKRLLKSLPSALSEVGTAVTVSLTVAPQLVESGRRINRARQLRGAQTRRRRLSGALRRVALPVAGDALDRSLVLASAMDSRGYGRRRQVPPGLRRASGVLVLGGLVGVCVGTYGLLDATTPRALGVPMLAVGLLLAIAGFVIVGRRLNRTRYRPDPWLAPEWAAAGCGLAVAIAMSLWGHVSPSDLNPSLQPISWPTVQLGIVGVVLVGALPGWLAPPVAVPTATGATSISHVGVSEAVEAMS